MPNLFRNFKLFEAEKDDNPTSMVDIAKKQLGVSKDLWVGMPILVSNTKLGDHMIREPTMFYVYDKDEDTVTLKNVPRNPGETGDEDEEDPDDEIDLDKDTISGSIEITITKDDFFDLQKPQGMQAGGGGMGMGGF